MAFVVAVAQRKGGAGKSTVACNLAVALAAEGHRVALIDIDPQASLGHWHAVRARQPAKAVPLLFKGEAGWRLPATLRALTSDAAFVIVDTPPHDDTDARIAIRSADLVLMPLQPSAADLWAADATIAMAAAERRPIAAFLNRMPPQVRARQDMNGELAARQVDVMAPSFGSRAPFATAFAQGLGVIEAWPRSIAATEARALAQALQTVMTR